MRLSSSQEAFFALLRAGLWEKEVRLSEYGVIDFKEIYRIAREQSVVGLVAAGLERVVDLKIPQDISLSMVGEVLQIEQRNKDMNAFVAQLFAKMESEGVHAVLIKGQGVAQTYERPLWRACGDVDLFFDKENYEKAKRCLLPLATNTEHERAYTLHLGMTISSWEVELHGTLRSWLWKKFDNVVDEVQSCVFYGGKTRLWQNGKTHVTIPGVDEDVFFIFSHILQHFFKGGIGLRQVCDWCRLLYTHRDSLNFRLLESRIRKAGILTEWKAFSSLAVNVMGMPLDAMPLYSSDDRWNKKVERVLEYILETGNFGHNRDVSYQKKLKPVVRKYVTMWRQTKDNAKHFGIFPLDSVKTWWSVFVAGIKEAVKSDK